MKICCLLLVICTTVCFAQSKLPVIRATSKAVSIRDDDELETNEWSLSPTAHPDVFTAERTRKAKWVTFYTDIDSIRTKVKPGTQFDFVVLLNGKDSCFTRIASAIPPEDSRAANIVRVDTVPFILTAYNAISFKAIINNTDSVLLHFDTGSWDFRLTKQAIIKKTNLLGAQPLTTKPDFAYLRKVNKIQIGTLTFNNPDLSATDLTAHDMDGRFGWNVFEGKQIELDFDKSLLIVYSGKFRKIPKGYTKLPLVFKHSFMIIKGRMKKRDHSYPADFLMDTGSEQAIILDSTWAAGADYPNTLKLIRTIVLHNPRGVKFETKVVLAPGLELNGFNLANVPALVLGSRNPAGFPINTLGGDVLKRFNIIMDFRNDYVFLKPNHLINSSYN